MANRTNPTARSDQAPASGWEGAIDRADDRAELQRGAQGPSRTRTAGGSDIADGLPPLAAKKLLALRQEREELATLLRADVDLHQELLLERQKAQARLTQLTDRSASVRTSTGQIYADDHPSVIQAKAEIDRLGAKLETLKISQDARRERRNVVGKLLDATETYVRALPRAPVTAFEMDPLSLPKGQTPQAAIERMRQRRRELLSDLKAVQVAPLHSSVAKANARAAIEALAQKAEPDVFNFIEGGSELRLPRKLMRFPVEGFVAQEGAPPIRATASGYVTDTDALFVRYHRDEMIADYEAQIDADADDANSLTADERAERSKSILEEILTVERQEEALTEMAGDVLRRPDLDPRAFLAIVGPDPEKRG